MRQRSTVGPIGEIEVADLFNWPFKINASNFDHLNILGEEISLGSRLDLASMNGEERFRKNVWRDVRSIGMCRRNMFDWECVCLFRIG